MKSKLDETYSPPVVVIEYEEPNTAVVPFEVNEMPESIVVEHARNNSENYQEINKNSEQAI